MVDEEDIPNVLSLNTAVMTGSRVFGPALAALLVGLVGTGWCFIAQRPVLPGGAGQPPPDEPGASCAPPPPRPEVASRCARASRFVWRDPVLRSTFIILTVVSTFAFNYGVSLLLVSSRNLGGGVAAFGLLLAVTSVGSFAGSLVIASKRQIGTRVMLAALIVLGTFSTLMGVAPTLAVAFVLAIPLGMGGAGYIASTNGIILPRVPPHMRGRVLALQATAFLGSTPIGAPITGWIGDHFGAGWSIAYGGLIALGCVAVASLTLRERRRSAAQEPAAGAVVPAETAR